MCVCVRVCVQTLRQHLQQENMKKAILGSGLDLQAAVGLISGGGIVPPTTPEIIQEAFKNVSTHSSVQTHAHCTLWYTLTAQDAARCCQYFACLHPV